MKHKDKLLKRSNKRILKKLGVTRNVTRTKPIDVQAINESTYKKETFKPYNVKINTSHDSRFPSGYRLSQDDFEGKGDFGKRCNVNACQLENTAFFFNKVMRKWYCWHCARDIYKANQRYGEADMLFDIEPISKAAAYSELEITKEYTEQ